MGPGIVLCVTMEEIEFNTYVLPLRDRMFRYAQSLLLSAAEAEDAVADLLERFGSSGRAWPDAATSTPSC